MLVRLLVLLAAVEIALPLLLYAVRDRVMFLPWPGGPEEGLADLDGLPARIVRVRRRDGRELAAYDVSPPLADAAAPVVLFLHGNAGNIAGRAFSARVFATSTRSRLLMPDYSGFGGNAGSPSEDEIGADALAAFDHLVAEGVPASRIVVYGESIGGGPAILVATKRPVAGLVVQSGFSSLSSMALRVYPWLPLGALLAAGDFPNAERLATVEAPVLVVHGVRDRIVPVSEGEKLAAAQPVAEFLRVEGADHNDLFDVAGDDYLAGLGERFRRWTGTR